MYCYTVLITNTTILMKLGYPYYTVTEHEFYEKRPEKRHGRNIYQYPTDLKAQSHKDNSCYKGKARGFSQRNRTLEEIKYFV